MAIINVSRQRPLTPTFDGDPGTAWRQKLRRRLLKWYGLHARNLPWRQTSDPYRIWVSEIMLQQTQVATVVDYYHRFLQQFPDVATLATAREQEVLRCWEGLGYYRRARQLHSAAQIIYEEHQGVFPSTYAEVLALPGIGRYTAGAILSISFDQRHPIVEANTIRLYARLLHYAADVTTRASKDLFWDFARWILPHRRLGDFNQALMELGSLVCSVKSPDCTQCPLKNLCPTNGEQSYDQIPRPKKKTRYQQLQEVAVVVKHRDGNRILLRQCQPDERWAGLWDFPRFALDIKTSDRLTEWEHRQIVSKTRKLAKVSVQQLQSLTSIRHGVTKYRITLNCFSAQLQRDQTHHETALQWIHPDELEDYPLSVTGRKISQALQA